MEAAKACPFAGNVSKSSSSLSGTTSSSVPFFLFSTESFTIAQNSPRSLFRLTVASFGFLQVGIIWQASRGGLGEIDRLLLAFRRAVPGSSSAESSVN